MNENQLKSKLGRFIKPDDRDKQFLISSMLPKKLPGIDYKYWWTNGWWGNQGHQPQCVAYSWVHWLAAGPITQKTSRKGGIAPYDTEYLYNEAQKIDRWPGECVDIETECLTKEGWKKYNELKIADEIYTMNINSKLGEWKKLQKINIFEDRDLISFYNKNYDIRVTENHKWVVKNRTKNSSFKLVYTNELDNTYEFPVKMKYSSFPIIKKYSDEFVKLVAWTITEGHIRKVENTTRRGNGICISQKKYSEHLKSILLENNITTGYENGDLFICEFNGDVADKIRKIINEDKNVDYNFILSLTKEQLDIFIEECILGDGSIIVSEGRKNRKQFHQKIDNGNILDIFLFACVLANKSLGRSRKNTYLNKTTNNKEIVETWSLQTKENVQIRKLKQKQIGKSKVWCPTTENGTFIARRNGNVFITGNSYDGTSVRAGAKVLQSAGYINGYNWAWDIDTTVNALLTLGPVVVGTWWYYDMFFPNKENIITATGNKIGGHAYLLDGVNVKKKLIRIKNSWGRDWGKKGFAYISFDDMDKLIKDYGEVCMANEINVI